MLWTATYERVAWWDQAPFNMFWNNRIMKIEEEKSSQIDVVDRYIAPWAERIEKLVPPPFGLSLIAIGRR